MSNRSITGYHLNTFTIRISRRFSSAREFQMENFQKYWSQNVGQDFIELDFFVGGRSCGRKRCVREINVSLAGDPVHARDKALTRETPVQRGRVNRYAHQPNIVFITDHSPQFLNSKPYIPDTDLIKHVNINNKRRVCTFFPFVLLVYCSCYLNFLHRSK